MKEYPKTYGLDDKYIDQPCLAFYKYDGSNLRFEYSKKSKKWYKFGTRRRLFDKNDPDYGCAIPLFMEKYSEPLAKVFHDTKEWKSSDYMIAYAEFLGPCSFSGKHEPLDPKTVVLIDVDIHRRGFVAPRDFVDRYGHCDIAKVVYEGPLTMDFFNDVRNGGKYDLFEGVMCKGGSGHDIWMCKIKTLSYLDKLKKLYGDKWIDHWE
jgi:hypothetical protein